MSQRLLFILLCQCILSNSWADLPLRIEDVLTQQHKKRVELGFHYSNVDIISSTTHQNSDALSMVIGGRYGINARTEFYTRLSASASELRTQTSTNRSQQSAQKLNALSMGINHQFSPDNDTPALLGFIELSVAENTESDGNHWVYAKTGQIGFSSYRSIDPVILSLTVGYQFTNNRTSNQQTVNPGDTLYITPSVGFAVNNEITLTGGASFSFKSAQRSAGGKINLRTSQTHLTGGIGYAYNQKTTLSFSVGADITGNNGAQSGLNLLYKL
jgi:hypothetical protein